MTEAKEMRILFGTVSKLDKRWSKSQKQINNEVTF